MVGRDGELQSTPVQSEAAPVVSSAEEPAVTSGDELSPEELERRRAALSEIMELMREAVQYDGGDLVLADVNYRTGVVNVELQGACGSCAISSMTLRAGVERMLKERLPWVREVHGDVDDSLDYASSSALGRGAYVPKYS